MQAGGRHFARRPQAGQRRSTVEIDGDAAHHIVRTGRTGMRSRVISKSNSAIRPRCLENGADLGRVEMIQVEIHVRMSRFFHLADNGQADDVAGASSPRGS